MTMVPINEYSEFQRDKLAVALGACNPWRHVLTPRVCVPVGRAGEATVWDGETP